MWLIFNSLEYNSTVFIKSFFLKWSKSNLLPTIIFSYLELVYKTANSKAFQIVSAIYLSGSQKLRLINRIRSVTGNDRVMFQFIVDKSLIGGLLIRYQGKVIDYSIKNKLKILAKQLDTVLEI